MKLRLIATVLALTIPACASQDGVTDPSASAGDASPRDSTAFDGAGSGDTWVDGASWSDAEGGRDADKDDGDAGAAGWADAAATDGGGDADHCMGEEVVGEGEPLADIGPCGKLVYRTYANQGESNAVNRLPDYSFAGYGRGGVAIPEVAVVKEVWPGAGDDGARIQSAVDEISQLPVDAHGFRGAVLLHKGTYEVAATLSIKAGGVVLRGEGQGTGGTVIKATAAKQVDLIEVQGDGSGWGEVANTRQTITTPYVPVGTRSFEVESAGGFSVGDEVVVVRTPNQAWIDALGMGPYGWTASGYAIAHPRKLVAVDGAQLTIDIPIVDAMQDKYGGGAVAVSKVTGRLANVGIEDLRLESAYASATDDAHGRTAVLLHRVTNAWVRRVTAVSFWYSAVSVDGSSAFVTVQDVAHLDPVSPVSGGYRYSFNVSSGIGVLFQRCYARDSRHDFVTGARVTGPNVWLDCLAENSNADDGPHHRWSTGLLFDNTKGEDLDVQNRTDSGTGHGWSGAQTLFWNSRATNIVCDAPKGAMNWSIGCVGTKSEGSWAPSEPFGWWESTGTQVSPRSLYLRQLEDRRGAGAVNAITLPAQRTGRIWNALSAWAGEGRLDDFVQ